MNFYLEKYGFLSAQISQEPAENLNIIVVIPCFNEPDLIKSLDALYECDRPNAAVEVITVINSGELTSGKIKNDNLYSLREGEEWAKKRMSPDFNFHFIHVPDLPKKHAGVGLARKIGMDEAVSRFHEIDQNGIIVCFDADATCDKNYLVEIEKHFEKYNRSPGCSIHYEHPLGGNEFDPNVYEGIINYELHLRYYNQALKFCGLPYAYHTVGSSMAVRTMAYEMQGGMNKRKAGEDFYFIHKIISLGGFTELKSTKVIPSPRISDRVPFGTGKAIGDWVEENCADYYTYSFAIFELLKSFVDIVPLLRETDLKELDWTNNLEGKVKFEQFLENTGFTECLHEIRSNTKGYKTFIKRFYQWFDAFKILKLVHYMRDEYYPNSTILNQAKSLLQKMGDYSCPNTTKETLEMFREIEKK